MPSVAIVGAGPVGATLALALSGHDLDVVAFDARLREARPTGDRTLALSHGSRLILERVGAWRPLAERENAITPITTIDVSQARGFGSAQLHAAEHGVEALGYVVSHAALQDVLDAALIGTGVDVRFGSSVASIAGSARAVSVRLAEGATIDARLAVVADGAGAAIAGIERRRHDYRQVALVASVWLDTPPSGVAFERFTAEGPVALLPERDHYALIWTMRSDQSATMLSIDERAFLAALAQRFGTRVTGFSRVTARRAFPLSLERAQPIVASRAVVVGNAAQQLHPVAGQGFNLGLRDAWELAETVLATPIEALGSPSMLARYATRRARDRHAGIAFTHGLIKAFGIGAARWPRGLSLALLDVLPPVKRLFTHAMLYGIR
ncbi:MAG TPA: FAD-dependent monooxygenase [Casimicrobiaceae bacterium]|nr:FAD-dependent monooxygenase [Casimicrobiaceae bacterium]